MVSTLEQMQVPNGTGSGFRRSKRPLLAGESGLLARLFFQSGLFARLLFFESGLFVRLLFLKSGLFLHNFF